MARARRKAISDNRHLELSEALGQWSKKHGLSEDSYIQGLTASLSEKKNLQFWAELSPLELLPRKRLEEQPIEKLSRRIALIRNILVFSPVALTWAAVGQATEAFSKFTAANPNSVANFLDFWQDGYGYLGAEWTISKVAIFDFALVMAVIVLTVVISIMNSRLRLVREAEFAKFEAERKSIGIALASYLDDKRALNNVTLNKSLTSAIYKLLNASDHIESSTKVLQKALTNSQKSSPRDRKASTKLSEEFDFDLPENLKKLLES